MDRRTAEAREALVRHGRDMGWLKAPLVPAEQTLMDDLVREGVFEFLPKVPGVHFNRYELTEAGKRWAEELS